ncbi:MAG: hypothetical protein ACFB4I_15620 [Cyanophyceae cyanobacterium]
MNNTQVAERFKRAAIRTAANPFLQIWGRINARCYDIDNTLIVASSGRGGSTWLAEIVGTLPGYPILYEPLNLKRNPDCLKYFSYSSYPQNVESNSLQNAYLRQIFTGANLSARLVLLSHFKPEQYLNFKGFIVKFIGLNLRLYPTLKQFPLRTLFMVRHPCAVVASQLRSPHWSWAHTLDWKHWEDHDSSLLGLLLECPTLFMEYPHLKEVQQRLRTPEEGLAFVWAVQNYLPLNQPKPHPWCLTTYEKLVVEGEQEIARLFQYLGKPVPAQAYQHLKIPSSSTETSSNLASGINPLSGWKNKLDHCQIDNILNIVRQVGINFYSDNLEPAYRQLFASYEGTKVASK